jgi:hypothetical protein
MPKRLRIIKVTVRHDEESGVWYVVDSNVPGLNAEADSSDDLRREVLALIPSLIEANATPIAGRRTDDHRSVPLELIMQSNESVTIGC